MASRRAAAAGRTSSILAVVALLIVGLWVVNARIDARKAEEWMESGRHNGDTLTR